MGTIDHRHGRWAAAGILGVVLLLSVAQPAGAARRRALAGAADSTATTWTMTGSLRVARLEHTATLLPDGTVLVAGGAAIGTASFPLAAELYSPRTGTWALTGRMLHPYVQATATLLRDGTVLVAGGGTAEVFDPRTGTWTATGPMRANRLFPTATLLPSGKVLVVGGADSLFRPLASAEVYDPRTRAWRVTGSLRVRRFFFTATLLPSGKVLVTGGADAHVARASTELYDARTGEWLPARPLHSARQFHTATLLPDGRVLVAGGNDPSRRAALTSAELYDPASNTWSPTGAVPAAFAMQTAVRVQSGGVLVLGVRAPTPAQLRASGGSGPLSPLAALYDPRSGRWAPISPPHIARQFATATLLATGRVLIAGGEANNKTLASAELSTPAVLGRGGGDHQAGSVTGAATARRAGVAALLLAPAPWRAPCLTRRQSQAPPATPVRT